MVAGAGLCPEALKECWEEANDERVRGWKVGVVVVVVGGGGETRGERLQTAAAAAAVGGGWCQPGTKKS